MRVVVIATLIAGCAYRPGSYQWMSETFPGTRATTGCLDVAIEREADLATGAVLSYVFANRCDLGTTVDLFSLHVMGRTVDGRELALGAFDPDREMRPMVLEARRVGGQTIEYRSGPDATPDAAVASICVDAAELVHATPAHVMCFSAPPPQRTAVTP